MDSTLAPTPHHFERFLNADERRVSVAFVFDDVPFHPGGRLTNVENRLPRKFVVTNERVGFGLREWFHVDARHTAGFLFQEYDGIAALGHAVAGVELNDYLLLRTVKKCVPWQLALE